MKKTIFVDPERCLSCRSCELACATAHSQSKELTQAIAEEVLPEKRIWVEEVKNRWTKNNLPITVPLQCRHCEDAPCVKICPTKALTKQGKTEPVLLTADRCIGCRYCVYVCPFGVIKMSRTGKAVTKCDLCVERLAQGQLPACVVHCPTKTIKYQAPDEVAQNKRDEFLVEFVKSQE